MNFNKYAKYLFLLIWPSLIELGSFLYFHNFKDHYTFFKPRDYTLTSKQIEDETPIFSPKLGWDLTHRYKTQFGERNPVVSYEKNLISTFGDSFTFCDQVNDNETWQYYLSKKLEKNVLNFGTPAYGTGQAFLKFRKFFPQTKTPIVILGFIGENINRLVNLYRPFYYPKTQTRLTKPRPILKDGELDFVENSIQSKDELYKLKDPKFIAKIGQNDYWYNQQNLPQFSFPYTKIFFNKHFWDEWSEGKYNDIHPRHSQNLWEDEEKVELMFHLIDHFVIEARKQNAVPIIQILPKKSDVLDQKNGEELIHVSKTLEYCQSQGYLCYNSFNAFQPAEKTRKQIDSYFNGHVAPKGNKLIAEDLYSFLQKHDLVN